VPAGQARRFVLRIDPGTGDVHVGPRDRLAQTTVRVADVRWLRSPPDRRGPLRCQVQIRHHAAAAPAWLAPGPAGGDVEVRLDTPAYGVAPGQAAVFYDADDRVLGGGWIV
jgi:tRNA-specific 2-thiouridylase